MTVKILVTCPPMIGMIEDLKQLFDESGAEVHCADVVQTLSEDELMELVPEFDGWIIGDDPATKRVFQAGLHGKLRAAVKWGVGVDNVDFNAARDLGLRISNTPQMFGREVADLAMCYVTALARSTHQIDHAVKRHEWIKPRGISLEAKTIGLVGLGDIGRNVARRAHAADMAIIGYDPFYEPNESFLYIDRRVWPDRVNECDFLVFTCALTAYNHHMLSAEELRSVKTGVRIINVARGPLIDEAALVTALDSGKVASAALDVFEVEPLPLDSQLRNYPQCIFGSHNASNTTEAVVRASKEAASILLSELEANSTSEG
jgi:D-3-phosphoglycerate dehydrogenase